MAKQSSFKRREDYDEHHWSSRGTDGNQKIEKGLKNVELERDILKKLKFIWPTLETRFIELPIIVVYNFVANYKFYLEKPRWLTLLKTVLLSVLCFLVAGAIQGYLIFLF